MEATLVLLPLPSLLPLEASLLELAPELPPLCLSPQLATKCEFMLGLAGESWGRLECMLEPAAELL
jgi:hypothetical protein